MTFSYRKHWKGPRGGFAEALWAFGNTMDGGRHSGRGRRKRRISAGDLQLMLLSLIEDKPLHGYAMIEAVEERTGGVYAPSPGVVYPTLTLLADMELAKEKRDGSRKLFEITKKGKAHLGKRRDDVDAIWQRLDRSEGDTSRRDAAPVWRAMMNLGSVLKAQMWDSAADKEKMLAAAKLIDDAAGEIERL